MKIKLLTLSLILLVLIACIDKQSFILRETPPEINIDDVLPVDPMITKGVLDNGLTYYVKYNGVPENRCELFWKKMTSRVWPILLNTWLSMVQRILRNMS